MPHLQKQGCQAHGLSRHGRPSMPNLDATKEPRNIKHHLIPTGDESEAPVPRWLTPCPAAEITFSLSPDAPADAPEPPKPI